MSAHAQARANDLYGIWLSRADIRRAEEAYAARAVFVVPIGHTRKGADIVAIRYHHQWIAAVVEDGRIDTFLPPRALWNARKRLRNRKRILRRIQVREQERKSA